MKSKTNNKPIFTIKIFGETYNVILKSELEMNNNLGLCHPDKQEIWLNEKNTDQTNRNVLLHECVHAIDYMNDLDMTERQVNVSSTALIALVKDNPELLNYFFGTGKVSYLIKPKGNESNG